MMPARILQFLPAIWCVVTPAQAAPPSPFPLRLGSHVLTVRSGALLLDGRKLAEAPRFEMDLAATVDGVQVAAVRQHSSNLCFGEAEILFAATGDRVVTGRVEKSGCQAPLQVGLANGQVVVVEAPAPAKGQDATPAVAASPGAVWLFDARHGAARAMGIGPEGPDQE